MTNMATDPGSGAILIPRLYLHFPPCVTPNLACTTCSWMGQIQWVNIFHSWIAPSCPFSVTRLCNLPHTAFLTEIKGTL